MKTGLILFAGLTALSAVGCTSLNSRPPLAEENFWVEIEESDCHESNDPARSYCLVENGTSDDISYIDVDGTLSHFWANAYSLEVVSNQLSGSMTYQPREDCFLPECVLIIKGLPGRTRYSLDVDFGEDVASLSKYYALNDEMFIASRVLRQRYPSEIQIVDYVSVSRPDATVRICTVNPNAAPDAVNMCVQ